MKNSPGCHGENGILIAVKQDDVRREGGWKMELLRTEHLCKVYGTGENQVHALRDVSFSVEKGEFVTIIGSSGSEKTTVLKMANGFVKADAGDIFINGEIRI